MLIFFYQVEYCPCSVPIECWNLMRELMQSFLGNIAETPPVLVKNKMDTFYSPEDTINQYLEHFNNFRKQTNMNQAIRWYYIHIRIMCYCISVTARHEYWVLKNVCETCVQWLNFHIFEQRQIHVYFLLAGSLFGHFWIMINWLLLCNVLCY